MKNTVLIIHIHIYNNQGKQKPPTVQCLKTSVVLMLSLSDNDARYLYGNVLDSDNYLRLFHIFKSGMSWCQVFIIKKQFISLTKQKAYKLQEITYCSEGIPKASLMLSLPTGYKTKS